MRKFNSLLSVTLLLVLFSCFLLTQVNSLNNLGKAWKRQMNTLSPMDDEDYMPSTWEVPLGLGKMYEHFENEAPDYSYDELHALGSKFYFLIKDTTFLMKKLEKGELSKYDAQQFVGERVFHFISLFGDEYEVGTRFQQRGKAFMELMNLITKPTWDSITDLDEEVFYDIGQICLDLFDMPDSPGYDKVVTLGERVGQTVNYIAKDPAVFDNMISSFYLAELGQFLLELMM